MSKHAFLGALALVVSLGAVSARATAVEPARPVPPVIVQKLDPTTGTLTSYRASGIDEKLKPSNIGNLSEAERNAAIKKFIDSVAVPLNLLDETKAERKRMPASELDPQSSTPAFGWRWRWGGGYSGWGSSYNNYGWYGSGFYGGYYNYPSYYYYPYWGYSDYSGYYGGYPYYGYSYSYYPYYSYSYPYYSVYGCY